MIVDIHPTMTDEELADVLGFDLSEMIIESNNGVFNFYPYELINAAREVMSWYPNEPDQWNTKFIDQIVTRNKRMCW